MNKYLQKIFKKEKNAEKFLEEEIEVVKKKEKNFFKKNLLKISVFFLILISFLIFFVVGYFYFKNTIFKSETVLRFGFVSDIEYGYKDKIGNKLPSKAPEALEKMIFYYNNEFHPGILIIGGDIVESSLSKKRTTIEQFFKMKEMFSVINSRKEYIAGNHDLRKINKEEFRNIFDTKVNHSYFDVGEWRFVLMDTNFKKDNTDLGPDYYIEGYVSPSEFEWLKEALKTDRPTILFSHHSSIPNEINGVFSSNTKNLSNGLELHNFLKNYKNLVMFISGHESGYKRGYVDGINYFINGNLVDKHAVGNFSSFEARFNKFTKKTEIIAEKHGGHAEVYEIEKETGDIENWKKRMIKFFKLD